MRIRALHLRPLLVLFLAACGSSSQTAPAPATSPPVAAPAPAPAAAPSKSAQREANSEPDVPTGAAAARDAELAKVAAGFLDAFVNTSPVLSRDGKKVVFDSNRDGLPQLYVADASKPDAPATRLVSTKERAVDARTTKDGKSVIFKSDKGADENWDFFRV